MLLLKVPVRYVFLYLKREHGDSLVQISMEKYFESQQDVRSLFPLMVEGSLLEEPVQLGQKMAYRWEELKYISLLHQLGMK